MVALMFWTADSDLGMKGAASTAEQTPSSQVLTHLKSDYLDFSYDHVSFISDERDYIDSDRIDWTASEDLLLKKWAMIYHHDWRRVRTRLPGRSAGDCRNRFEATKFDLPDEPGESLRDEIEKFAGENQDLSMRLSTACFRALRSAKPPPGCVFDPDDLLP